MLQGLLTVVDNGDLKELKQLLCFCSVLLAACPCTFVAQRGGLWWLHSEIVLGISGVFLSVSFFSQTGSLAPSAGPALGDSPNKSNQLCAGGTASKERAQLGSNSPPAKHEITAS